MRSCVVFGILCLFMMYCLRIDHSIDVLGPTYKDFKRHHIVDVGRLCAKADNQRMLPDSVVSMSSTIGQLYGRHERESREKYGTVCDFGELVVYKREMISDCHGL